MAASGDITIYTQSVDYGGGRGAVYSNLVATWNVDDNGYFTLSEKSYNTSDSTWWICSANATSSSYQLIWQVQFLPDGASDWQTLYDSRVNVLGPCSSYTYLTGTNVKTTLESLCNGFSGTTLTSSGQIRICYGASVAPAPSSSYPNAFPDLTYSAASQVPVYIELDYRPGARKISSTWRSLNRSGGVCSRKVSGSWVEMKTENGGSGTGNPPSRRTSGIWYNQNKIGAE